MPNDAELRRTGMSFTRAFTATAMCSPSRATLPHRQVPLAARGHAHDDPGRPVPRPGQRARRAAHGRRGWPRAARCRAAGWPTGSCAGALRLGPKSGNEPELRPGTETLATLLRERGYHVVFKGKWHLSKPVSGDGWSAADSRADRARLRLRRVGAPGRRRRRQGRDVRRGERRHHPRGLGRGLHAPDGEMARRAPSFPSRSAWSFSLVNPARRARLPVLVRAGRLLGGGLPRARRAAAGRRSTRTCATSRRCTR